MGGKTIGDTPQYNARVNSVLFKMARYIPIVMLVYGLLVHFKLFPGSDLYSWQALVALTLVFVVAGVTQDDSFKQSKLRQAIYYLLFLSYSVFVVGMGSIIIYWAPLSMSTVLNFGMKSYWWSTLLLFIFTLIDGLVHLPIKGSSYIVDNFVYVGLVTVASFIAVSITTALMEDHDNLIKAKKRESLQYGRMQALINSLSDAIISVDAKGVVRLYNASTLNLLDSNVSYKNHKLDDVLPLYTSDNKKVSLFSELDNIDSLLMREDLYYRYPDGESIRLGITGTPIRASFSLSPQKKEGYIFIIKDITKSKSLEEEKDEFISVVSHELRTPITISEAALSNTEIIATRESAKKEIIEGIRNAHSQVLYLSSMINDLSTLSRAERNGITETESIKVSDFLKEMYHQYADEARNAQLLFNLDDQSKGASMQTNKLYLEEILQNFITNAIKYTPTGSVTLSAKSHQGGILFSVIDTGLGISKSEKEKVFEKFYRSEDYRTRETSGTGLGLYVSQKLALKLGTSIALRSRLHHGSAFSIFIK